jgi:hypothetical protein
MPEMKPLGIFGPQPGRARGLSVSELNELRGQLGSELRRVAEYLSGGYIIFAIMEYTTDVIEGAFGVSGGSAIMSDGVYYWRSDAEQYVSRYGIDVGEEAVEHMRSNGWTIPKLSAQDVLDIDSHLFQMFRRSV